MTKQTKTKPSTAKPQKDVYISLNLEELAALERLGFRERWAYIAWKRCGNFKTGVVGEFKNKKLSQVELAAMVKAPPGVQGRGGGGIDDTQAGDFLQRMEAVGLVSGIGRRANGGLRFELPLSPIGRKKTDQADQSGGEKADIFPTEAALEIPANPSPIWDGEEFPPPRSVLIKNKKININTDPADPSNDGAAPCRAEGAAPVRENLPAAAGGPAPLTAQQIHDALADSWTFTETGTPDSWKLYESWAGSVTLDDLHAAMISVEEHSENCEAKPSDLMPRLWPVIVDNRLGLSSA